jgi:hypothetical protein
MLLTASILSSCISPQVKEKLNVKYNGPDEFSILSHEPLTIPNDFSQPLPSPGHPTNNEQINNAISKISSEEALLKKAKANKQQLDNIVIKKSNNSWFESILNHSKQSEYKIELPKNSLDIIRNKPDYTTNTQSKRVCDIAGGSIRYCDDDNKLMKSFEVRVK